MRPKLEPSDIFVGFNAALLVGLCAAFYEHSRYRGPANLGEFLLYAAAIAFFAGSGWLGMRRARVSAPVLLLMEVGVLAHFAGGFVPFHGGRLYDAVIFGVGFDKFVHLLNAVAGCVLVDSLLPRAKGTIPRGVFVGLTLLGVGSLVEVVEYLAHVEIASNGVGDYDNNSRDLIANAVGVALYLAGRPVVAWLAARKAPPAEPA